MKGYFCLLALCFTCTFYNLFGQARYWVGPASGGVWSSTANWSITSGAGGGASFPTTTNDAIFDNGVTTVVEMDVLTGTSFTINSLLITNNTSVTLLKTQNAGGSRNFILTSASAINPGLKITSASTLTIEAINTSGSGSLSFTLSLTGANAVTGEIEGTLQFKGTSSFDNAGMNLYSSLTNNADLHVRSGGLIKFLPQSGNTNSSALGAAHLTMEDGSVYEINKNGGSLPEGTWADNSTIRINGITSSAVLFNQINYGNLIWDCPAQSAALQFISSTSPVTSISLNNLTITSTNARELRLKTGTSATIYAYTVRGVCDIQGASNFVICGSTVTTAGSGARISFNGNLNLSSACIFKSDGAPGTINEVIFSGTIAQTITNNITNSTTITGSEIDVVINNPAGVILSQDLVLPGTSSNALQLTNGRLITTASPNGLLTMLDNAMYSGGSTTSFVEGPMRKQGDDNFTFPVGVAGTYAPITMTNDGGQATGDEFQAQYFRGNPQSAISNNINTADINHISFVEYWRLDKISSTGTPAKFVTLDAHRTSFILDNDPSHTFVSKFDGSIWNKISSTATLATCPASLYQCGSIAATTSISTFSPFTIATNQNTTINPLPIRITLFDVVKLNSSIARISWDLAACCSKLARFEVLKSMDGINYRSIETLAGSETETKYAINDPSLGTGITYYRLKGIDADGKINYSRVIAVMNNYNGVLISSVWPNPAKENITINIASSRQQQASIGVFNMSGSLVYQSKPTLAAGNIQVSINITSLIAGNYKILLTTADGSQSIKGFIKE